MSDEYVLRAQIAGYGRDVSGFSVCVMCALLTRRIAPERAIWRDTK